MSESQLPNFSNTFSILESEIGRAVNVLKNDNFLNPRVKYPEEKFKKYFAPFFLGIFEPPQGENIQALWAQETGSLQNEVEVVDRQGNTLFVVPPMLNTNTIDLASTTASGLRFSAINQIFEEDSRNFPEKARLEYFQNLSSKLSVIHNSIHKDTSHIELWIKIFKFYNIDPEKVLLEKTSENKETLKNSFEKDFEFKGNYSFDPTFDL